VRQQQPGVEAWIVDAGLAQAGGCLIDRFPRGNGSADRMLG
jgi:hypothetical protein